MWFHLQTHHHREYAAMESQERARPASSGSSTCAGSSHIATANTSGIIQISDIPSAVGWPHCRLLGVVDNAVEEHCYVG